MKLSPIPRPARTATLLLTLLFLIAACGGGGGGNDTPPPANNDAVTTLPDDPAPVDNPASDPTSDPTPDPATFTVTTTAGQGGAIAPASATVAHGTTTRFTISPDIGFVIDTVSGCGGTLNGNTFTTGPVTADCAVSATFAVAPVIVSVTASAAPGTAAPVTGGTVTGAGSFNAGDPVTLAARPAPGFAFVDWRENGATVSTRAAYAFTAAADRRLTARFRLARPLGGGMPASSATTALALGDLDGDGHLDMVAVNGAIDTNTGTATWTSTRVWLGDGQGGFADSGQALPGGGIVTAVALGDLDGDGDPDLVFGVLDGSGNRVWLNDGRGRFTDSGRRLGSTATYAVALGDLDGDGDLDLVTGEQNSISGSITIWTNDGHGAFSNTGRLRSGNAFATYAVALGDLDGDGDLDLVAGNGYQSLLDDPRIFDSVWKNDGSGNFTDTGQRLGGYSTRALALGDLDGDGDLDLVAGNAGINSTVWKNDGQGTFTLSVWNLPLVDFLEPAHPATLALGDLDGDGDLDLVLPFLCSSAFLFTCSGADATALYLNDGSGAFGLARTFSGYTGAVALGDLDGDGDLDLVEGRADGNPLNHYGTPNAVGGLPNRVWLGDGQGDFRAVMPVLDDIPNPLAVAAAPLDAAPGPELVICAHGACAIHAGDARGRYGAPLQTLSFTGGSGDFMAVTTGDLNGDGAADILVADDGAHLFLSDGAASGPVFSAAGTLDAGTGITAAVLGDLDGDGDLDLVTGADTTGADFIRVWRNDGSGGFTATALQAGRGAPVATLRLGDLDGDGDPDLVATFQSDLSVVFTNDGNGDFSQGGSMLTNANQFDATLADFDGDGRLDLAVATDSAVIRFFRGNGDATFADTGRALATAPTYALAATDLDGDGDPDLVAGHDGPDSVWVNDGNGIFTAIGPLYSGMGRTRALLPADLDGDGDPDLLAAHPNGGGLSIHRNAAVP